MAEPVVGGVPSKEPEFVHQAHLLGAPGGAGPKGKAGAAAAAVEAVVNPGVFAVGEGRLAMGTRRVEPLPTLGVSTIRIGFPKEAVDEFGGWVGEFFLTKAGCSADDAIGEKGKAWQARAGEVRDYLGQTERAEGNIKPRNESRKAIEGALEKEGGTVIQLAYSFADGAERTQFVEFLKQKVGKDFPFEIRQAGSTTVEIGAKGITKAASISYISDPKRFESVLDQAGYQGGQIIDARVKQMCIVADADGTLFHKPESGKKAEDFHLGNSAAKEEILAYLRSGGFLVVNSGNDAKRIADRIRAGIPEEEKGLLRNIAVGVNGGHALYVFDKEGKLKEVEGYRDQVVKTLEKKSTQMHLLYLGDDVKPPIPTPEEAGNDWDGYEKVGFERSIAVPVQKDVAKLSKCEQGKKPAHVIPGNEAAAAKVFKAINTEVKQGTLAFTAEGIQRIAEMARQ